MESILIENRQKLCRLCLKIIDSTSDEDLISIFSHCHGAAIKQRITFADILKTISTLNVTQEDEFPKKICELCVQQVRSSFVFKTRIEKSHVTLTETFKTNISSLKSGNSSSAYIVDHNEKKSTRLRSSLYADAMSQFFRNFHNDAENDINDELSISTRNPPMPTRKLTRNDKEIFKLPQSNRNSMEEIYNRKLNGRKIGDAKVVLEPFDTLETYPCSICNRIFCNRKAYLKHDFSCVHNCQQCKIDFQSELNFKAHFMKRHNIDLMVESVTRSEKEEATQNSEVIFYTKDEFVKKFIKNRSDHWRCMICLANFDKGNITTHLYSRHLSYRPFKCSFCDDKFSIASVRNTHMAKRHIEEYRCEICETQFAKHAHLENHCKSLHNISTAVVKSELEDEDPKTDTFLYVEKKPAEMKVRNRLNSQCSSKTTRKITSFFTSQRNASCESKNELNTSQPIKTEDEDYDKNFEIADFLETNIVTDETRDDNPEEMQIDEDVPSVSNDIDENDGLEEIMPTFTYDEFSEKFVMNLDNVRIKCIPCNNEMLKTSFKLHIRNCHARKSTFFCELCPRGFMKYEQRRIHMRDVHTNDFRCELCEKQFFHSKTFKEHMLFTHSEAVDIKTLKTADELDIPMEKIQFIERPKEQQRVKRGVNGHPIKGKNNNPPKSEEFSLERFKKNFIVATKNGRQQVCTICSVRLFQKTMKPHLLEKHAITNFVFCEICDEGFNSEKKLKAHMEEAHPGKQKCVLCENQFIKEATYLQHMKYVHSLTMEETGRTKLEDIPIENIIFTDDHPNLKKMSSYEYYELVPDDIEMSKDQFYAKFMRVKTDDSTRAHCLACGISFRDCNRRQHIDIYHATTKAFSCDFCLMRYSAKSKLKTHMSIKHTEDYKCSKCDIQFIKGQQYLDHMKDEHGEKLNINLSEDQDVSCEDLKYVRTLEKNKINESKTNAENSTEMECALEEKVNCQYCNQEFNSERMHRNHLRLDCSSNPNNMSIQSADIGSSNLQLDPDDEMNSQEFPCEFCDKICTSKKMHIGHRNWHVRIMKLPSEKPKSTLYDCEVCSEVFAEQRKLYGHIKRFHKSEFYCGQCGSQSGSYIRAKAHLMSQHPKKVKLEMSRRHKCPQCFRFFNMIDSLNDHIKHIHVDNAVEKSNYCLACGIAFPNEKMFKEHQESYQHKKYEELFNAERDRDLAGEPETYNEEQESEDDNPGTAFDGSSLSLKRKRGHSTNSWASTSSSSMTSSTVENSTKFDDFSQTIKKEKLEFDSAVETTEEPGDDDSTIDETAYRNFMRCFDGIFKCLICEITKPERKFMLQHLKQHDQVPKYSCNQCSESFLFKVGFDKHMENHQEKTNCNPETSPISANRCEICDIEFKLSIMLNRHNARCHSEVSEDNFG